MVSRFRNDCGHLFLSSTAMVAYLTDAGRDAACVGTAVTRPATVTSWFVEPVAEARGRWSGDDAVTTRIAVIRVTRVTSGAATRAPHPAGRRPKLTNRPRYA